jgi:plasmid replication initiation protein
MRKYAVYANIVNSLNFSDFTRRELDLFMAICSLQNGKASQLCVYSFQSLKEYLEWHPRLAKERFSTMLADVASKLIHLNGAFRLDHEFFAFNLFSTFKIIESEEELLVRTNPDFVDLLNYFVNNFTTIELREYISLKNKYAKLLYQNLRQYKNTGVWYPTVNDLKKHLSSPSSYTTKYLISKVLEPAVRELSKLPDFQDIQWKPITRKSSSRITAFEISWKPAPPMKYIKTYNKPDFKQNEYDFDELEKSLTVN